MTLPNLAVAACLLAFTVFGFVWFPGHTYLQSDTQIYIPILEHLWDPGVLQHDFMAVRPHVAYTIYDDVLLALRRWFGFPFALSLTIQQLLYRWIGLLAVYLIGRHLRLERITSLLLAGIYGWGIAITGPAVLSIEFEPVPRGFALPFVLLALALVFMDRPRAAAISLGVGLLFHPPTALFLLALFLPFAAWQAWRLGDRAWLGAIWLTLGSVVLLWLFSRTQVHWGEPQPFFARIAPDLERLMRFRASYNWVSMWAPYWYLHYVLLGVGVFLGLYRLGPAADRRVWWFLGGLSVVGVLTIPLSWLLLEQAKWSLMPQFQPGRATLFVVVSFVLVAVAAARQAARQSRWIESCGWLIVVSGLAVHTAVFQFFWTTVLTPIVARRLLVSFVLAALLATLLRLLDSRPRWSAVAGLVVVSAAYPLVPRVASIENYPALHTVELLQLSDWARNNTSRDSVFQWPEAGRNLAPGIFRANSLRALYVDWKGGGQVNFLPAFGAEWWRRWQQVMGKRLTPEQYAQLGIEYIVLPAGSQFPGVPAVYDNRQYVVYRIPPNAAILDAHNRR